MTDFLTSLLGGDNGSGNDQSVALPPELESYLPPEVWRRLNSDTPRRGVLINALDRLRSLLYLLTTYLPANLAQERTRRAVPGRIDGQMQSGTLLFSDVSGFTALSERLAVLGPEGAERLTNIMNDYFSVMLEILSWSGGILLKFAGDATLVYFPGQENEAQAAWAVRAGQRMMAAMSQFSAIETPVETVGLKMKIGIATGSYLAAAVGSAERMEYVVFGEGVANTMAAEGAAEAGLVVVDAATAAALQPEHLTPRPTPGFYAAQMPDEEVGDFEIRPEARRGRGAIPWNAAPHAIIAQMEIAIRQIQALIPFLAGELVERIISGSRRRQIESEYRPATVMFVNFTGFEPLLAALVGGDDSWSGLRGGSRQVTQMLSDFFNEMHQCIARYGGVVTRIDPYSKGSKMLILFGAPTAHEDDPQRAVSAALAMRAALAKLNENWAGQLARLLPDFNGEPPIQMRLGVTQGMTFAGEVGAATRREYTVMGDDVNLSARLMGASAFGQILLSKRVYEEVATHFDVTPLTPIQVKGKSQPIPIFQVEGTRDDPLSVRLANRKAWLGRERDYRVGRAATRQAMSGQGRLLLLRGGAGLGKSHLGDQLVGEGADSGAQTLFGECHAYSAHAAYAPWAAICRRAAGIGRADSEAAAQAKLDGLLTRLNLPRQEYMRPLANLLGIRPVAAAPPPPPAAKPAEKPKGGGLFASLEKKVAAPSAAKEAGQGLWSLTAARQKEAQAEPQKEEGQLWRRVQLQVAARERERLFKAVYGLLWRLAQGKPLLVYLENGQWLDDASRELLAFIHERLDNLSLLLLLAERGEMEGATADPALPQAQLLPLQPASLEDTALFIQTWLGEDDPALAAAIHQQSEGNPLYIEEMVLWLQRGGGTAVAELKAGLRAAVSIQELVLSRIDSLPVAERETARVAAVIGASFSREELILLREIREGGAAVLHDHLSRLQAAQIILLTEAGDDARYSFRQSLTREVLYDSQPFARRRELHGRLALYLETKYKQQLTAYAEQLAHHFERAEEWLPAARYMLMTGHKARERFAYRQAAADYRQAIALLDKLPAETEASGVMALRLEAQEVCGDALLWEGDYAGAATAYEAALALEADEALFGETRTWLMFKLAFTLPLRGRDEEAEKWAQQGWERREPFYELEALIITRWLAWRRGEDAGDLVGSVRPLVIADDPWRVGVLGLAHYLSGDWAAARKVWQEQDRLRLVGLAYGREAAETRDRKAAVALYEQAIDLWCTEEDKFAQALGLCRLAGRQRGAAAAESWRAGLELWAAEAADSGAAGEWLAAAQSRQRRILPKAAWRFLEDSLLAALLFRP